MPQREDGKQQDEPKKPFPFLLFCEGVVGGGGFEKNKIFTGLRSLSSSNKSQNKSRWGFFSSSKDSP